VKTGMISRVAECGGFGVPISARETGSVNGVCKPEQDGNAVKMGDTPRFAGRLAARKFRLRPGR